MGHPLEKWKDQVMKKGKYLRLGNAELNAEKALLAVINMCVYKHVCTNWERTHNCVFFSVFHPGMLPYRWEWWALCLARNFYTLEYNNSEFLPVRRKGKTIRSRRHFWSAQTLRKSEFSTQNVLNSWAFDLQTLKFQGASCMPGTPSQRTSCHVLPEVPLPTPDSELLGADGMFQVANSFQPHPWDCKPSYSAGLHSSSFYPKNLGCQM